MEPFYNWRDGIIYAVFIYGAHYVVVISWFTRFEDVVSAVREHCVDEFQVKEPIALIVLSSTYMDEKQAMMMADDELINLTVGR